MATPDVPTRRATPADLPALTDVLGRAFADDPMFVRLVAPDDRTEQRLATMFTGVLTYLSNELSDTFTTDERDAVAVWNPPGYQAPQGLDGVRMLRHMAGLTGWPRVTRMLSVVNRLDRRHHQLVPEPHWYLLALAVAPGRQGQGLGSALMRPTLKRCDRDRLPAYLETATPRNLPLYQRHGFAVVDEVPMGRPSTPIWLMRREPAAPTG